MGRVAGLPIDNKLPVVELQNEYTPATFNDPKLSSKAMNLYE